MNNQAFQKLSPNHPLTNEQNSLINRIIKFAAAHLQNKNIPAGRVRFQLQLGVLPLMAQIQITGLEHRAVTELV